MPHSSELPCKRQVAKLYLNNIALRIVRHAVWWLFVKQAVDTTATGTLLHAQRALEAERDQLIVELKKAGVL